MEGRSQAPAVSEQQTVKFLVNRKNGFSNGWLEYEAALKDPTIQVRRVAPICVGFKKRNAKTKEQALELTQEQTDTRPSFAALTNRLDQELKDYSNSTDLICLYLNVLDPKEVEIFFLQNKEKLRELNAAGRLLSIPGYVIDDLEVKDYSEVYHEVWEKMSKRLLDYRREHSEFEKTLGEDLRKYLSRNPEIVDEEDKDRAREYIINEVIFIMTLMKLKPASLDSADELSLKQRNFLLYDGDLYKVFNTVMQHSSAALGLVPHSLLHLKYILQFINKPALTDAMPIPDSHEGRLFNGMLNNSEIGAGYSYEVLLKLHEDYERLRDEFQQNIESVKKNPVAAGAYHGAYDSAREVIYAIFSQQLVSPGNFPYIIPAPPTQSSSTGQIHAGLKGHVTPYNSKKGKEKERENSKTGGKSIEQFSNSEKKERKRGGGRRVQQRGETFFAGSSPSGNSYDERKRQNDSYSSDESPVNKNTEKLKPSRRPRSVSDSSSPIVGSSMPKSPSPAPGSSSNSAFFRPRLPRAHSAGSNIRGSSSMSDPSQSGGEIPKQVAAPGTVIAIPPKCGHG